MVPPLAPPLGVKVSEAVVLEPAYVVEVELKVKLKADCVAGMTVTVPLT
jgi:hypothetical protein